jgi:hypothetical protein
MSCPYQNFIKPTITFCESNLCSHISQPANTWSNLAFVFVGILLWFLSRRSTSTILKLLAPLAIIMGLTSFLYHASYTFFGQLLDLGSMFLFSSYLLVFNIRRLCGHILSGKTLLFSYVILNAVSIACVYFIRTIHGFNIGIPIFALQIIAVLVVEFFIRKKSVNYRLINLVIALAILVLGWGIWLLDYMKIWCDNATFHWINGHAMWHIISAISLIFVYKFYRQFSPKTHDSTSQQTISE